MAAHFDQRPPCVDKNTPVIAKAFFQHPLGKFVFHGNANYVWSDVCEIGFKIAAKETEVWEIIFESCCGRSSTVAPSKIQ